MEDGPAQRELGTDANLTLLQKVVCSDMVGAAVNKAPPSSASHSTSCPTTLWRMTGLERRATVGIDLRSLFRQAAIDRVPQHHKGKHR